MNAESAASNRMARTRRDFLGSIGASACLLTVGRKTAWGADAKRFKAAIIGRTGGGDYGHGYDVIFRDLPNVSVEAIADANPEGLRKAAERSGAKRQYADYREMLEKEKPHLVSIAPRQPDCHREMALAAIAAGAHILIEKPFTEHLNEADEITAAAEKRGVKIAVAHNLRYSPNFARMRRLIEEGFFGTILDMRVQGKQDSRVGGEDMIVLGSHDFDTMRSFFGDPLWCFATVTENGKPVTRTNVRKGRGEPITVAGDTVRAQFQFPRSILCTWQSVKAEQDWNAGPLERWGFILYGTKRVLSYYAGSGPRYMDTPLLGHKSQPNDWKPIPDPRNWPPPPHESHLARNLIYAIENDAKPLCSGMDGRWTIEMIAAVYESHRARAPVQFPLAERTNPLFRL